MGSYYSMDPHLSERERRTLQSHGLWGEYTTFTNRYVTPHLSVQPHVHEERALLTTVDTERDRSVLSRWNIRSPCSVGLIVNIHESGLPTRRQTIIYISSLPKMEVLRKLNREKYSRMKNNYEYFPIIYCIENIQTFEQAKKIFLLWKTGKRGHTSRLTNGRVVYRILKKEFPEYNDIRARIIQIPAEKMIQCIKKL